LPDSLSLEPDTAPDLSVSIVTYNSAHCLNTLLDSLALQEGVRWELFVVDNASSDDSAARVREWKHANITINRSNVGFGRGHNQNLYRFRGRHVLFLNPDLTFSPGLFAGLVNFLDANPGVAVAGPAIVEGAHRIPSPPRRFYPGESIVALEPELRRKDYAWVSGCCLAIRRPILQELGGFDPDYFLYGEETDLCLRVRQAGYKVSWCPEHEVEHAGLQSQIDLSDYARFRNLFEGTALFWEKHYPASEVRSMIQFQYLLTRLLLPLLEVLPSSLTTGIHAERIRARRDVCRELVSRLAAYSSTGSYWRIGMRQLRVLVEWARGGAFPLDAYFE
jgi:GT2 family glycosyltransferase